MQDKFLPIGHIIVGIMLSILIILLSKIGTFSILFDLTSAISFKINTDSYNFFSETRENIQFLTNLRNIKEERDILLEENLDLTSQKTDLQQQLDAISQIKIQESFALPFDLKPVFVVKVNELDYGEIMINKGKKDSVIVGNILVYEKFAIGEVIQVTDEAAIVRLIISPKSRIPAISMESKTKGIIIGNANGGVVLDEVLVNNNLNKGEIMVTSGINSVYPYGLILGSIDEIFIIESELTKSAKLTNRTNFSSLHELYIIEPQHEE